MKHKNKNTFLGGTCNNSTWREKLIKKLNVPYFNPVVDDWDEKAQKKEVKERETARYVLYVITPLMTGVYSIAEVVDDSNKRPESTLFCVLEKDGNKKFKDFQLKSLNQVKEMIKKNGGQVFETLEEIASFLNKNKSLNENNERMQRLAGLDN